MRIFVYLILSLASLGASGQALNGNYTIGGTNPDYSSFGAAVTALATYGVSGPVLFLADTGIYTERVDIPLINGASTVNTITFRGDSADSSQVILQWAAAASALDNYVLRCSNSMHITFESMSFRRNGSGNYARVIELNGSSTDISFASCRIEGISASNSGTLQILVYGILNSGDRDISFDKCYFTGGNYAIRLLGPGTFSRSKGFYCSGSDFEGQYGGAIWISYFEAGLILNNNTIAGGSLYSSYTGIHIDNCAKSYRITSNRVFPSRGTGIRLNLSSSYDLVPALVANNLIHGDTVIGLLTKGIELDNSGDVKVYYNSVHLHSGHPSSVCLRMTGLQTIIIDALNNNLSADSGLAVLIDTILVNNILNSVSHVDYNNLFTWGAVLGAVATVSNYSDLTALVLAGAGNSNSVSVPVMFLNDKLRHNTPQLDNAGTAALSAILPVTWDIDGDNRSVSNPDIGADEFAHFNIRMDALIIDTLRCINNPDTLFVQVSNLGGGDFSGPFNLSLAIDNQFSTWIPSGMPDTIMGFASFLLPYDSLISYPFAGSHSFQIASTFSFNPGGPDTSNILTLRVVAPPAMTLGSDTIICPNHIITFQPDTLYDSYSWYNGQSSPSITIQGSMLGIGTHDIWLRVSQDDCHATDSLELTVISCSGIQEQELDRFCVYPNPVTDFVQIRSMEENYRPGQVYIFDNQGKLLLSEELCGSGINQVYVGNMASGYYHILVINSGYPEHHHFVKH